MTQGELANKLGIKRTYLNGILGGKRKPGIALAERIAKEMGIDFFKLRPDLKRLVKEYL